MYVGVPGTPAWLPFPPARPPSGGQNVCSGQYIVCAIYHRLWILLRYIMVRQTKGILSAECTQLDAQGPPLRRPKPIHTHGAKRNRGDFTLHHVQKKISGAFGAKHGPNVVRTF